MSAFANLFFCLWHGALCLVAKSNNILIVIEIFFWYDVGDSAE